MSTNTEDLKGQLPPTTVTKPKAEPQPDTLQKLVDSVVVQLFVTQPGTRSRFFDKANMEKIFGLKSKDHIEKAQKELEQYKPPLTKEGVKRLYQLFGELNKDIEDDPIFKAFNEKVKAACNLYLDVKLGKNGKKFENLTKEQQEMYNVMKASDTIPETLIREHLKNSGKDLKDYETLLKNYKDIYPLSVTGTIPKDADPKMLDILSAINDVNYAYFVYRELNLNNTLVKKEFEQLPQNEQEALNEQFKNIESEEKKRLENQLELMRQDVLGGYRFKTISKAPYYDEGSVAERQRDYMQLVNNKFRDGGSKSDPEKIQQTQESIHAKISKELVGLVSTFIRPDTKESDVNIIISTILEKKHQEYLGSEEIGSIIKKLFDDQKSGDMHKLFHEKFAACNKFSEEIAKTLKETEGLPPDVISGRLDELFKRDEFQNITTEHKAQIGMNHVMALPFKDTRRTLMLNELSKKPLMEFIKKTLEDKTTKPETLIKNIMDYPHYLKLDTGANSTAAEVLAKEINNSTDIDRKNALIDQLHILAEKKMDRRLGEKGVTPEQKIEAIQSDHLCGVLNQERINKALVEKIYLLPKDTPEQKESRSSLLKELNSQTGKEYEFPKSGWGKFKLNATQFFQKTTSAIGSFFKNIGNGIKDLVTPQAPPPKEPTVSAPINVVQESGMREIVNSLKSKAQELSVQIAVNKNNPEKLQKLVDKRNLLNKDLDTVMLSLLTDEKKGRISLAESNDLKKELFTTFEKLEKANNSDDLKMDYETRSIRASSYISTSSKKGEGAISKEDKKDKEDPAPTIKLG